MKHYLQITSFAKSRKLTSIFLANNYASVIVDENFLIWIHILPGPEKLLIAQKYNFCFQSNNLDESRTVTKMS